MDFDDYQTMMKALTASQDADSDLRDAVREAHLFVSKRDGQWEPQWWNASAGKPRYTFDFTSNVVTQIAGNLRRKDFDARIKPASGPTSQQDALLYDGLVRGIEAHSKAKYIYNTAARNMVTGGLDGWMVVQEYADSDAFEQELRIKPIANYVDSVWFDVRGKTQCMEDARFVFVLEAMPKDEYDELYPDRSGASVEQGIKLNAYYDKADHVIIGQVYYIKTTTRTLVKLTSGRVLEADDDFEAVREALAEEGEEVVAEREREKKTVWSRKFDGTGWLEDEEETVFECLPVVPLYGNFRVLENKVVYFGAVEKLLDPQRVYNYAKSREIEEGALAPRAKYWMTTKQAAGFEKSLQTLNTNADPVQFYNFDPDIPGPPQQQGGAETNAGLVSLAESMAAVMDRAGGIVDVSRGDNPGLQSGVAIEKLQEKGDTPSIEYQEALELAIAHTGYILVKAIPRVYSEERQAMLVGQDGRVEPITLNVPYTDPNTGQMVTLNDVTRGSYTVTCTAGPSFVNRQQETVAAITEIAAVNPAVLELGSDILYANMTSPGMDQLAGRARYQLLQNGMIPDDQLTPEEAEAKQAAEEAAAQQPPEPDPNMVLAEAESKKADAQTQKIQVDAQVASANLQIKQADSQARNQLAAMRVQGDQQLRAAQLQSQERRFQADQTRAAQELRLREMELRQRQQAQQTEQMLARMKLMGEQNVALIDALNTQADTLRILREAMGADAVVSPQAIQAYQRQVLEVRSAQAETTGKPNGGGLPPATT